MKSILAAALVLVSLASAVVAQRVPPLSMTCPMHPDVVESRPGSCPLCKMSLVPVRLDTAYICPVHTTVMNDEGGTCRLCRRQMMPATVALTWTCLNQPGIDRLEPGVCPDGLAMIPRRTLRPHGNHNPQHGGLFFMAPDNWHHLEGTYPRERTFRLYLYDDFARPLPAAEMKRVQARVVTSETWDPKTRKATEITAFPLRLSGGGRYFEARVDPLKLPAAMTAKIRFKPDAPEYRFDFTFATLSKEPASAEATARRPASPTPAPRPAAAPRVAAAPPPTPTKAPSPAPAAPLEGDLEVRLVIPDTISGILEQLRIRDTRVRELIEQGNFAAVWVPAFQAKDLAVALEPHMAHLAPATRASAEPAVQRLVQFAWLLDAFGDIGNRQQLEAAYATFQSAVAETIEAFSEVQ